MSATLEYFASHGIDEKIAKILGVDWWDESGRIDFPYTGENTLPFRRERDVSTGKTFQPKGTKVVPWTPVGTDGVLLVCEGESDCLAAISALYEIVDLADEGEAPDRHLYRKDDLPPPVAELAPIAIPGANSAHQKVADLAEKEVCDVWIALDGDEAGRTNAEKLAKKINAKRNCSAGILNLPDGKDLADLLAAADDPVEALANLIAEAEAGVEDVPVEGDGAGDDSDVDPLPPEFITGLLEQALDFAERYVVLPGPAERSALALWIAHSHAADAAHATPYLLVLSPEKRSGKTRLLETVELLVSRPWRVTGASEAAMFRKIEADKPTLLLDEIDAIFGSNAERTEPLRAILNAGNRPGAAVARVVGEGHQVHDFGVFGPKILAGIDKGHLMPDTIRDRAITISMVRKTGAEPVERFRHRVANAEAQPIRDGFAGWAAGAAADLLYEAEPDLPDQLDDRAAEAWEPLLAIADLAGGEWPSRAREAAIALSADEDRDEITTGTLLLRAIRGAFGEADRIATTDLLAAINADEELPFGGWRDGNGIDGRRLAKLLKPYGVRPRPIRFDDQVAKGYLLMQFEEVWERWLPPDIAVTAVTTVTGNDSVTQIPLQQADVTDVTDVTPVAGSNPSNGVVTATPDEEDELERIAAKLREAA